jgi:hypothetical protein
VTAAPARSRFPQARLDAAFSQISSPRRSYQTGFICTVPLRRMVPTLTGITSSRKVRIGSLKVRVTG